MELCLTVTNNPVKTRSVARWSRLLLVASISSLAAASKPAHQRHQSTLYKKHRYQMVWNISVDHFTQTRISNTLKYQWGYPMERNVPPCLSQLKQSCCKHAPSTACCPRLANMSWACQPKPPSMQSIQHCKTWFKLIFPPPRRQAAGLITRALLSSNLRLVVQSCWCRETLLCCWKPSCSLLCCISCRGWEPGTAPGGAPGAKERAGDSGGSPPVRPAGWPAARLHLLFRMYEIKCDFMYKIVWYFVSLNLTS
jgi:hypothetical protein